MLFFPMTIKFIATKCLTSIGECKAFKVLYLSLKKKVRKKEKEKATIALPKWNFYLWTRVLIKTILKKQNWTVKVTNNILQEPCSQGSLF